MPLLPFPARGRIIAAAEGGGGMTRKKKTWLVIGLLAAAIAGALTLRAYRAHAFDPDAVSVPILMYHSVCPDKALAGTSTSAEIFSPLSAMTFSVE